MGAPLAFLSRTTELSELTGRKVTPEEVTESFLQQLMPARLNNENQEYDGLLLKYLQHGQIALLLGDTMFVHGAIHNHNMG
jgi:hypothetical protein